MHTVLTGLQNIIIKNDLKPCLLQLNTSDELLLEKLNIACANEKERQNKKKHTVPSQVTNVNIVQSSDLPIRKKCTTQQSAATLLPDLLSEIKEMCSMMLLKDLRAEVSQFRESIQRSTPAPPQYPSPITEPANMSAPYPFFSTPPNPNLVRLKQTPCHATYQQSPATMQEYQPAFSPGRMKKTAQFQQRFTPQ